MIRVVAPSRLHFGLFHIPEQGRPEADIRAFGGVGLMIDSPGVVVVTEPAESWQFEGPLASRAQFFAMRFLNTLTEQERRPFRVLIQQCPHQHTGLGVGTQLGLAVAKSLAAAVGRSDWSSEELAVRVGRGERSSIGVHGFDRGGLLMDGGKRPGESISPLVAHTPVSPAWRIVVFTPPVSGVWDGSRERDAFAQSRSGNSDALRNLAESHILPAAQRGDLLAFGEAVHEFNRMAGEPFAAVQGGPYSSPTITDLIAELRSHGIACVGQSSWGPTVFAIVEDHDTALSLVLRYRSRMPVSVARASAGHRFEQA